MKGLDQNENGEQRDEPRIKVVPEQSHGKAGLSESDPGFLIHVLSKGQQQKNKSATKEKGQTGKATNLHFNHSQVSKEELLQNFCQKQAGHQNEIVQGLKGTEERGKGRGKEGR